MANEKRRLTVGNDNWQEITKIAESVSVFSGTCDEDEPLLTVAIRSRNMWHQRPYIFHCLPGDILVEYDDGTWGLIEKETKQSRAMTALAGKFVGV